LAAFVTLNSASALLINEVRAVIEPERPTG
jgi:hypothetical protein